MDIASFHSMKRCCLGMNLMQMKLFDIYKSKKKKKHDRVTRYFETDLETLENSADEQDQDTFSHQVTNSNFLSLDVEVVESEKTLKQESSIAHFYANKNKEFSEKLLSKPTNVKLWIDFVEYQDEYFKANHSDVMITTKYTRALIEKKLSILDKALIKNPTSIKLMIYQMNLLKEITPSSKMIDKWKNMIFRFPNRSRLWKEYLLFIQTDLITMKVSNVIDVYRKAFQMLTGVLKGSIKSHPVEDYAVDQLFLIYLQFIIFLWQAGHTEKVIGMLECMVEFNIFVNSESYFQFDEKKEEFESFYDSEVPRFSNTEAKGWKTSKVKNSYVKAIHYLQKHDASFDEKLKTFQEKYTKDNTLKPHVWIELEQERTKLEFAPYTGEMEECDDTDRIVLYDDISFSLFNLSNQELNFQLILTYLFILGVPIDKNMISQQILNGFSKHFHVSNNQDCLCYCHSNFSQDYISIPSILTIGKTINEKVITKTRCIFEQSLNEFDEKHQRLLSQVWFHFESILFRKQLENLNNEITKKYWKEQRKFIKALLRINTNRNNLALWEMYAFHEKHVGNEEDCEKVMIMSLQLCHQQTHDNICVSPVASLVRSMIESKVRVNSEYMMEPIQRDEKSTILNFYLTFLGASKVNQFLCQTPAATDLLKLSSTFQTTFHSVLSTKTSANRYDSDFIYCYIMFNYLFNGVDYLCDTYDELINLNHGESKLIKALSGVFTLILMILKTEMKTSFHHFAYYKIILEQVLLVFPDNPFFNHWFILLKQNGLNSLHARRIYEKNVKDADSVYPWLYYIKYEEKRLESVAQHLVPTEVTSGNEYVSGFACFESSTGLFNRVKCLYERLLKDDRFRFSADIWCQYMLFTVKYANQKSSLDVFNRALSNCCGSKMLILKACEKFKDMFKEFYDLMVEKEVRVKLLIEELDILLQ